MPYNGPTSLCSLLIKNSVVQISPAFYGPTQTLLPSVQRYIFFVCEKQKTFNSSAFSIMNRKHKTIVNKYTKNCNKIYFRPMVQPVKEEKEKQRGRECRGRKADSRLARPPLRLSPADLPPSALLRLS